MKLKFLVDENIAGSVVNALRKSGYDVKDVKEEKLYGLSDSKILEMANEGDRIIITHDKDFMNLLLCLVYNATIKPVTSHFSKIHGLNIYGNGNFLCLNLFCLN